MSVTSVNMDSRLSIQQMIDEIHAEHVSKFKRKPRNIYRGLVHFRYPNKYKGCRRVTEHGSSVRMLSERECEKLREFVQRCVDSRLVEA